MPPSSPFLEFAVRKDRAFVTAGLLLVIALSWAYVLSGAGMDMTAPMQHMAWSAGHAVVVFAMWWIMMVAMMLPSAAPVILLAAAVNRRQREPHAPCVRTAAFVIGYLAVWGAFSLVATGMQWTLERAALLSPMMRTNSALLDAILLLTAGLWQLTPIKHACLRHCRSPLYFLSQARRPGHPGAFCTGVHHGAYCLGCCWFLMGLLFFGGVMNLYWIIGLSAYVVLEKTVPAGHWVGRAVGTALCVWGLGLAGAIPG